MKLPKTVGLISLGCSKNRVDSEILLGKLLEAGIQPIEDLSRAELLIVNTCAFIEPAKEESIETIFELVQYKQPGKGHCRLLFVTGCLSQRYPQELFDEMPEVDGFLGVASYDCIMKAIENALQGKRPLYTEMGNRFPACKSRVLTTQPWSAYVKLSDGCDNRCTYCAIPLIRGNYVSRPYADILEECRTLTQRGVHEITLIAQDTSRYGNDFPEKTLLLPDLLRDISAIDAVHWLRVLYTYPDTVNEKLLDTIAELPKVSPYLDLPLQHINADLLRRMNRRGSPEHIRALLSKCRERGILVRTTMIVGFPGETDEQFQELLSFIREARFDRLGAFTYSPEDGTPAAEMPDQIEESVKQARLDQLMMLQQEISLENGSARIGKTCEVLIEEVRSHTEKDTEDPSCVHEVWQCSGRSILEAPEVDGVIRFTSRTPLKPGEYTAVRITNADPYDLRGEAL